ncbi:MAG: GAF domain-containing protein, partial [Ignavibacteria bacterium]
IIVGSEAIPLLEKGANWQGELEAIDHSGKKIPIWSTLGTIKDESGIIINAFAFSHDISSRVMMENQIIKQKELYRHITERTNDLIFIFRIKPEMGFEYVSPSAEKITGYTPDDHYNDPLLGLKLIHPDDRHVLNEMMEGDSGNGQVKLRWIKKDGTIIWTEQRSIFIYDGNGEVAAIQGNATDITERVHSEQILEARLRISEYSVLHTRDQVQRNLLDELEKLTDSNIGFFHVVEADQERVLLQCWSTSTLAKMCKAEVTEKHYNIADAGVWAQCFYVKKPVIHNDYKSVPHRKGLPDGHSEILRELVVPVLRNDQVMAMIGIGNKPTDYNKRDIEIVSLLSDMTWDIVERKAAEEELQRLNAELELRVEERTAQLTEAYRQMESFAYSISHDLNTPLRHIKGFAEILMEIKPDQRSEEEQKCINTISESADAMGKLIEALLMFSKLNHVELQNNNIHTSSLVKQAIESFDTEIQGRKINFKVGDLPDCSGDEQLVKQVWLNLISNAIKYTSKKHTATIEIGSMGNDKQNIYFVKDNGVGFDMKYAQKLFGVFQRFHNTRDFPGVGIGLANVNSIVTRHNGRCYAESKVDHGATFYFTLPKIHRLHK